MRRRKTARPSNLPGICSECRDKDQKLYCKGKCRKCYMRSRWRARHREAVLGRPRRGSESWTKDWLKRQAENYLRENAGHYDRNGTRLWAMAEDQVIDLCRIIYMAVDRHKKWGRGDETYSRRLEDGGEKTGRGSPGEWDKYEDFVDHSISSSFRHGFSRIREG